MIQEADQGFFFRPPASVTTDFPAIPVTQTYGELKTMIRSLLDA
jgi:phosphoserine/homoserine phosphotransferase